MFKICLIGIATIYILIRRSLGYPQGSVESMWGETIQKGQLFTNHRYVL